MRDRRAPAVVNFDVMQAALAAYQGGDRLAWPQLCYSRLSHAVAAALRADEDLFRRQMLGDMLLPGASPEGGHS